MDEVAELERGRHAYAQRAWLDAYTALSQAERAKPLGAEDLELLAWSAGLVGRMDDFLALLDRLQRLHLDEGRALRAARVSIMLGMTLATGGQVGPAMGWFGRAERLVEREGQDCVERGYLLLPLGFQRAMTSDFDGAFTAVAGAAALAEHFDDPDLFAAATHFQGMARIKQGKIDEGLRFLDEAMVGVTSGEVSPYFCGIVYCGVIAACEEAFELQRAREWTDALSRWCEDQPQLVAYSGRCLAHRAGIMQLQGQWRDALDEARLARERCEQAMNRPATGQAYYQQGELHRLRGHFDAAEAAYRDASRYGREPQPGLALLRLAQGEAEAAAASIRRALGETKEPLQRAVLLPAQAEIMLAVGDQAEASKASRELEQIATENRRPMLAATAAYVRGAVELAGGDAQEALVSLRRAWQIWEELEAPYEAARARALVGLACRALGDDDGAGLELEAARGVFEALGATPDLARLDSLTDRAGHAERHGLSARELQVLRLVASGKTNREIASELVVSEHTVARHIQNIFNKLNVSSRTAATAFAFEHGLV